MDFGPERWVKGLAALIEAQGKDQFWPSLADLISVVSPINSLIVTAFTRTNRPRTLFDNLDTERVKIDVTQYDAGAYLLDPFYLACQEGISEGVYRLRDLAPDHFNRSEYYRTFYKLIGINEELGVIVPLDGDRHILLSLERIPGQPKFSRAQVVDLQRALPILGRLIVHQVGTAPINPDPPSDADVFDYIDIFGRGDLSKRERQVARLILRGHSSHSIAENLVISYDTVKNHRKRLFAKLEISSQSELFQLFLASLPLKRR